MTSDVLVRRCTVTVRRRSGWSWGPDPKALLRQALASLEASLASVVADLEPDAEVTVSLPLTLRFGSAGVLDPASSTALAAEVRRAVVTSAARPTEPSEPAGQAQGTPEQAAPFDEVPSLNTASLVAILLARWFGEGVLAGVLASWPESVLTAWESALGAPASDGAGQHALAEADRATVERVLDAFVESGELATARRGALTRLLVLAALAASLGSVVPGPDTQAHVRSIVEGDDEDIVSAPGPSAEQLAVGGALRSTAIEQPTPQPHPAPMAAPTEAYALPLLVLAQLDRVGYLETADAALHAAGMGDRVCALGAALAGKCLDPPERGWMRRRAERATVAVAGGLAGPPPDPWLAQLAQRRELFLMPLRSALEVAYTLGRSKWEPVTVARCPSGIVIAEQEGLMPIASVADESEMDSVLELLGRPPMDDEGALELAAFAAAMAERPAIPRADAPELERHLGAAVGTALALLASDLWGEEGSTSPLLALRRLGDLDALVESGPDGLVARLPLGRRRMDLQRSGALEDATVPWFPAGRLRFSVW